MSHVTTQLGGESGIQYKGVEDKTNLNQVGNMANMLMLVEDIPRGRLDQAMTITSANLTPLLGREKDNLYLQAVEDALKEGVPSVKILRISGTEECPCESTLISFQNSNVTTPMQYGDAHYILTINGVNYEGVQQSVADTSIANGLSTVFQSHWEVLNPLISYYMMSSTPITTFIENQTYDCLEFKLIVHITPVGVQDILETRTLIELTSLCARVEEVIENA